MKRLIGLGSVLAVVLAGCGQSADNMIVGEWECEVEEGEAPLTDVTFEFTDDGEYVFNAKADMAEAGFNMITEMRVEGSYELNDDGDEVEFTDSEGEIVSATMDGAALPADQLAQMNAMGGDAGDEFNQTNDIDELSNDELVLKSDDGTLTCERA